LLSAVIALLNLPDDVDKQTLLQAMLVREELGSTGFGEGIAIPHARYPIVTHISHPVVSICFTEEPVEFGALDGKPVQCLFTLISPTVRSHLQILSRIAYVLQDAAVKDALVRQSSRETIWREIERVEQRLADQSAR
jgi:PTS system nitrogen regulatory IIA component